MTQAPDARTALAWFTHPRRPALPDEAALLLSDARRETVPLEGEEIAVWRWGSGPVALLVHGWEGHAAQFHRLVPVLLARGHQVVAPDMPAHGASTGRRTSVIGFGRTVVALARHLASPAGGGQPVAVFLGHSVGSAAGLHAFARGLQVQRSIHVAGPLSYRRAAERFARAVQLPPAERAAFLELVAEAAGPAAQEVEPEQVVPGLRHPGLLLHDPADGIVPFGESVALATGWRQARLVSLPASGHVGILEDRRLLDAVEDFLPSRAEAA